MSSFPLPVPDTSEDDTQPYVYSVPTPTLDLLTVDAPRSSDYSRIATRLAKNADDDFWLPTPPPITVRMRAARALRRLANYVERGGR